MHRYGVSEERVPKGPDKKTAQTTLINMKNSRSEVGQRSLTGQVGRGIPHTRAFLLGYEISVMLSRVFSQGLIFQWCVVF